MKTLKFECLRCGDCCRHIINELPYGGKAGLCLLKPETELFPSKLIYPLYGRGIKGKSRPRPKVIIAWQLEALECPYITQDNQCKIYDRRPLACRQFPLEGMRRFAILLHRECRFMKQHLEEGEQVDEIIAPEEIAANNEFNNYLVREFYLSNRPMWTFDLTVKKWKKRTEEDYNLIMNEIYQEIEAYQSRRRQNE